MKHSLKTYRRWMQAHMVDGYHRQPLLVEEAAEQHCKNCGTHYRGYFCPNCGQTHKTMRFTLRNTLQHLLFFFTKFDSSFWHTCTELYYRPGYMIRDYIRGHRIDYFRPIQMLVCLTTIYLLLSFLFGPEDGEHHLLEINDSANNDVMKLHPVLLTIQHYVEAALNNKIFDSLALAVLYVVPNWWCFRRTEIGKQTNLAEHFYLRVYVNCQVLLLDLLIFFPCVLLDGKPSDTGFLISFMLMVWDYHQFFDISWWRSFKLSFLANMLTLLIIVVVSSIVILALVLMGIIEIPQ